MQKVKFVFEDAVEEDEFIWSTLVVDPGDLS